MINFIAKFDLKMSTKIIVAILLSNLAMIVEIGAFALIFFVLTKSPKTFIIYIRGQTYEATRIKIWKNISS